MPTPLADPVRHRLRLSPRALATAVLLLPGPVDDRLGRYFDAEAAELRAAGVISNGMLAPWAAHQLVLMLAPALHVEAVVTTAHGETMTQFWARPDAAVVGQSDPDGSVDLSPTEPRMLAWTLADVVGLGSEAAPAPDNRRPVETAHLRCFEGALSTTDHTGASAILGDGRGLSGDELAVMAALVSESRKAWRVIAKWTSPSGPMQRSLAVVDAGPSGMWSVDAPLSPTPSAGDREPVLVPISVTQARDRLIGVLPPGDRTDQTVPSPFPR